jgi:hypothetical protein
VHGTRQGQRVIRALCEKQIKPGFNAHETYSITIPSLIHTLSLFYPRYSRDHDHPWPLAIFSGTIGRYAAMYQAWPSSPLRQQSLKGHNCDCRRRMQVPVMQFFTKLRSFSAMLRIKDILHDRTQFSPQRCIVLDEQLSSSDSRDMRWGEESGCRDHRIKSG